MWADARAGLQRKHRWVWGTAPNERRAMEPMKGAGWRECLTSAEGFAGRESIAPGIRHPHLCGINPLAAGPHFLACNRHKATLHERRDRADAKAIRGQKRLCRTVSTCSGDNTLLGTERHWLDWFGRHRAADLKASLQARSPHKVSRLSDCPPVRRGRPSGCTKRKPLVLRFSTFFSHQGQKGPVGVGRVGSG